MYVAGTGLTIGALAVDSGDGALAADRGDGVLAADRGAGALAADSESGQMQKSACLWAVPQSRHLEWGS